MPLGCPGAAGAASARGPADAVAVMNTFQLCRLSPGVQMVVRSPGFSPEFLQNLGRFRDHVTN